MVDALTDEDLSALERLGTGDIGIPADLLQPQRPGGAARLGAVIPYQPSEAFTQATGISPEQYDTFRGYLARRESQSYGEPPISTGSAATPTVEGRYQMSPSEIGEASTRLGISTPTTDQFLANPQLQEQLFENYTLDHHNQLMNNPMYANGDAATRMALLAGAHLGGPGGVTAWQGGENRRDKFGTGVGDYINGMYAAATGGQAMPASGAPGGPGAPLMRLASATMPVPLSGDEQSQLDQIGNGQAIVGLPVGMTPEQALANPHPSMVTSDPETLGIPKGATPMLDPPTLQRQATALALGGMNVGPIQAQLDQLQQGRMLYRLPDGTAQWLVQPGGPADPKRAEYNELLQAHARATGELVPAYMNTPYGQVQIQVPKDQYLDYQRKFPSLQLAPGQTFPAGAATPPAPPSGAQPPGRTAPGQPPGAAAPGAPGAAPMAAPAGPGVPTVTDGKEGPSVVAPPPGGPGLPQGLMGPRYMPPGAEVGTQGQITSDQKAVNDLQDAAREAQRIKSLTAGVTGALENVTTGRLGEAAGQVSSWLKAIGMPDNLAQQLTGTQTDNAQILIKMLLQQAAAQMAGSGHGFNLFNEFLSNLPSIETSKDAIKMFENTVNMQAQRALDNRDQAVNYFNQSLGDYRNGRTLDYNPLTTFQSKFDQVNPDLNYYRAAQMMNPAFAKEGVAGARDAGTSDQVVRLIPRGATFYDETGAASRRDQTGNIVRMQTPGAAPGPAPIGGAQAAPLSPSTIETLRRSGMPEADIARILGAPGSLPEGIPPGSTLQPDGSYRSPDGKRYRWRP